MNILLLNKDLRIENNYALKEIAKKANKIYIFYFFHSKHLDTNAIPSINYLKYRLHLLSQKLIINIFETNDEIKLLQSIHQKNKISSIYINQCFTPFALKRQEKLKIFCQENNINFYVFFDYLNFHPGEITTYNGKISKTYAPFRDIFLQKIDNLTLFPKYVVPKTHNFEHPFKIKKLQFKDIKNFPVTRNEVINAVKRQTDYKDKRDQLADFHFASKIAVAINWGVVAFVEIVILAYQLFGAKSEFLRQLIFREFYYHYYYLNRSHYIISSNKRSNILGHYDTYPWSNDDNDPNFQAWKNAQTGVKLIDAAMNELATTFNMKNRMRMVVASFLTKDLNVHWHLGERHFAKLLVDYDPVINNQSWQWAAGSGLDYRGASRIFSVIRQQEKYDPFGLYIKKFLPQNHKNLLNYNRKQAWLDWNKRRKDWSNQNTIKTNIFS